MNFSFDEVDSQRMVECVGSNYNEALPVYHLQC